MGIHQVPVVFAVKGETREQAAEELRSVVRRQLFFDWWLPNDGEARDGQYLTWSDTPPPTDLGEGYTTDGEGVT